MARFAKVMAKDYLRSLIITLISAAIAIPLICVLIFVPLAIASRTDDTASALLIMVIPATCFLLIIFGGGMGTLFFVLRRRARQYDALFTPSGLTGKMYMINGRQYQGTVQGHQVDVRLYRGPALDIRVDTTAQTRLSIANSDAVSLTLARAFGREPLELSDPDLSGITVFAHDEGWAISLLINPEVKALLPRLILSESSFLMRQIHLEPGRLRLFLYRNKGLFKFSITPEQTEQWLNGLLSLARIAESLPDPR
ncbi:MAG: hypothetical protein JXA14_17620 [Anaerolineae bacterium]|nr:hypothetical protein [Anaerolineae bacterium]